MTTHTSTELQAHYIAGLDAATEDARLALRSVMHDAEAYREALVTWRGLRVLAREARLDTYGLPCEPCEGTGEIIIGSRANARVVTCSCCDGYGRVLPEDITKWENRRTERDPDAEIDHSHPYPWQSR